MTKQTTQQIDIATIVCELNGGNAMIGFTPNFENGIIRGVMIERMVDLDELLHNLRRKGIGIMKYETIGDFHNIVLLRYSLEN